jgi:hemerythrin-like domain-containing protein
MNRPCRHAFESGRKLSGIPAQQPAGPDSVNDRTMMLSRLLTDHDHIRKTLNLLEIQFLDLCRGRTPDYAMMLSILVYIQEYPEQAHHPLEDAMFAALIRRDEEGVKLARDLIKDHTELEIVTRKLRSTLESTRAGDTPSGKLKRQLSTFISRQRHHLYAEEEKLYPLAKRLLTQQDWRTIEAMVPRIDDPVFGERTQNDYELLYRAVEASSTLESGSPRIAMP